MTPNWPVIQGTAVAWLVEIAFPQHAWWRKTGITLALIVILTSMEQLVRR